MKLSPLFLLCAVLLAGCDNSPQTATIPNNDATLNLLTEKWIKKTTPMGLPNEQWAHD